MRRGIARVSAEPDRTLLERARWGLDISRTRGGRLRYIVLGLERAAGAEGG